MWARVKDLVVRAWVHGHSDDPVTWVWHYLQSVLLFWLGTAYAGIRGGLLLAGGIFAHRETSDGAGYVVRLGFREAVRKKFLDGFMDLLSSGLGIATGAAWYYGGLWGLAGGVAASAGLIFIVAKGRSR